MSLASFTQELDRLVSNFDRNKAFHSSKDFQESQLRVDFVSPLFEALGWDVSNRAGNPPHLREVVVESRVEEKGHRRRADYTFQVSGQPRLVVETKRPSEDLEDPKHILQLKKYAWNLQVRFAVLTNFLQTKIYAVPAPPVLTQPNEFLLEQVEFLQYLAKPDLLYGLLSKERVLEGALDKYFETIPKHKRDKAYQRSLFRLRGSKMVDDHFLDDLMEFRRDLARDIVQRNSRAGLTEPEVNEAVQRVIDRIVFLRIGEDRGIIYDPTLLDLVEKWGSKGSRVSFYPRLVEHFGGFNRPYNGLLFKRHSLSEGLDLSDEVLAGFIERISVETSPYRFDVIPVEILGSIYERFLGSVVRITPARVKVEEKPEVRKAGGVYYTPKYIVDYIVSQTVGKLLEGSTPEQVAEIRVLDPACGSGSFLLGAFTRIMEYLVEWFHRNPKASGKYGEWFYLDETGSVRLTPYAKRHILLNNLFGVDIDPQACEVTQLSLYLKLLEGESAASLREHQLKGHAEAFLPDLRGNIKCGNSLVGTEFEDGRLTGILDESDIKRINPFNWQAEFPKVMVNNGFDVVIGNPPYDVMEKERGKSSWPHIVLNNYAKIRPDFEHALGGKLNLFRFFIVQSLKLTRYGGRFGMIVPLALMADISCSQTRRHLILSSNDLLADCFPQKDNSSRRVFRDAKLSTVVVSCTKSKATTVKSAKIKIRVYPWNSFNDPSKECSVNFNDLVLLDPDNIPVPLVDSFQWSLCRKLHTNPRVSRLGDVSEIAVNRGEINQTIFRKYITTDRSMTRLLKGVEVGCYLCHTKLSQGHREWFDEVSFLKAGFLKPIVNKKRIATQRITGVDERLRLVATTIDPPAYFADSTNSIVLSFESKYRLEYILGLFNSKLFQWRFKITSTNNNVGTNEIESLPFRKIDYSSRGDKARHDKMVRLVERMMELHKELAKAKSDNDKTLLQRQISSTDRQINALVYDLYGLTKDEIKLVEGSPS